MYAKSFLLVLLGCSLVLATPIEDNTEHRVARSILGTFANWLKKADESVDSLYERVKKPVAKLFNMAVETGEGVGDYGKEKVQQVLDKYYEIRIKSEESLSEVKNQFLGRVISELQQLVDVLSESADGQTLEKLKLRTKELADSGKVALEKLQQQIEEAIRLEKERIQEDLDKWEKEANEVAKEKQ